jgi:hypothetical protein
VIEIHEDLPISLRAWRQLVIWGRYRLGWRIGKAKQFPSYIQNAKKWPKKVARLSKTTLEEFYKTNIWNPLGMIKSTYHPTKFRDSSVLPYLRNEVGELKLEPLPVPIEAPTETAGHGVWSTPNDYVKLLGALLDGGGPILSQKSVDEIFTP